MKMPFEKKERENISLDFMAFPYLRIKLHPRFFLVKDLNKNLN